MSICSFYNLNSSTCIPLDSEGQSEVRCQRLYLTHQGNVRRLDGSNAVIYTLKGLEVGVNYTSLDLPLNLANDVHKQNNLKIFSGLDALILILEKEGPAR